MNDEGYIRYKIKLYGIVQGVGFRPFIYNKAVAFGLKGYVKNEGSCVLIDAEGELHRVKDFIKNVLAAPPPLAQLEGVCIRKADVIKHHSFEIIQSSCNDEELRFIPKDTAVCHSCREDVFTKSSPWYNYAFTNCTNCGPRYSIIKELPYDRCNTAMDSFDMCSSCRGEYNNPQSRRYHAQPVCCEECGPKLMLIDSGGIVVNAENPIKEAAKLLRQGKILAVKGIGGFHLMCDAESIAAIACLRSRKRRPHKPLAVMAADIQAVEQQCFVNEAERQLLSSAEAPIVLLDRRPECSLPQLLAPDTKSLGMLLPYTPLHLLIFSEGFKYLVATSGNISGMPIEYLNHAAMHSLYQIPDYILLHNRDINIPLDDSVARAYREGKNLSRIGRGYAPLVIKGDTDHRLVSLGAEQKSSVSISQKGYIHTSQYIGDIKAPSAFENYGRVIDNMLRLLKVKPQAYIHDLHPQYMSTKYAYSKPETRLAVQHHFAHMASCMAEHRLKKPAIGIIYDGTGLGDDNTVWGGELLVSDLKGYMRAGHLRGCQLQGGDKAVEQPWRTAISYLYDMGCRDMSYCRTVPDTDKLAVAEALQAGFNCHKSSSMGRLFDCVSALLGLCSDITYDAQAAIILENCADKTVNTIYEYDINEAKACLQLDYKPLLNAILADIRRAKKASEISAGFHNTIAAATADMTSSISRAYGIKDVVLSGGCFENLTLLELLLRRLEKKGFRVYYNQKLPCNDGGISFGQLAAADRILGG